MKYTIISRDEYIKLIKSGAIDKCINHIVDEKNQEKAISEILKSSHYDDPFGYVVIEFTYEESFSISHIEILVKLDIKDIINIYCLTNEALDFYKTKVNLKTKKFKLFKNQELIKEVDSYKLIEDKKKGIKVLFDIFKLNLNDINEKFNTEYISELLNYKENNYLEQEYKNFYFDLFCYERKNSFFKEDIGFLADIKAILTMKEIRKDKEIFLSGNYQIPLKDVNEQKRKPLFEIIKQTINTMNETKQEMKKNIVVASIFLKSQQLLNTESREDNYWESFINLINEFKEEFSEETKEALWYLGAFLGYKYLYDDYNTFLEETANSDKSENSSDKPEANEAQTEEAKENNDNNKSPEKLEKEKETATSDKSKNSSEKGKKGKKTMTQNVVDFEENNK